MAVRTHPLRGHRAAMGHPFLGDGKYGGPDAFLTGSVSRKMHLHARRLIIDAPEGGTIDVTADLPTHFAASMEQMGFDLTARNAEPPVYAAPARTRSEKKKAAQAHANTVPNGRGGARRPPG